MFGTKQSRIERCAELCRTRGRRVAASLVASHEDAEDVLQQALLVASRKPESIPAFAVWPWLSRVIVTEAYNLRRQRARDRTAIGHAIEHAFALPAPPATGDPFEQALTDELRGRLRAALDELPEPERDALSLVYAAGLSPREAAKAANIPYTTFRRCLDAATTALRTRLGVSKQAMVGLIAALSATKAAAVIAAAAATGSAATTAGTSSASAITSAAATSGAAASSTAITGAILMTGKQLAAVATVLLLAGGGIYWGVTASRTDDAESNTGARRISNSPPANPHALAVSPAKPVVATTPPVTTDNGSSAPAEQTPAPPPRNPRLLSADGEQLTDGDVDPAKSRPSNFELPTVPFTATIRGRVLTEAREPVAGAVVTARAFSQRLIRQLADKRLVLAEYPTESYPVDKAELAKTAENGAFEITVEGRIPESVAQKTGPFFTLEAAADGLLPSRIIRLGFDGPAKPWVHEGVILLMSKPAGITGVVRARAGGGPAVGAWVSCIWFAGPGKSDVGRQDGVPGTLEAPPSPPGVIVGSDGAFSFTALPAGKWRVYALPPGWMPSTWRRDIGQVPNAPCAAAAELELGDGKADGPVTLTVGPPCRLTFRTDPPVERASTWLIDKAHATSPHVQERGYQGEQPGRRATLGPDATFTILGLSIAMARLDLWATGFRPLSVPLDVKDGEDLDLGVLKLEPGSVLRGIVVDSTGAPIGGARINVVRAVDRHQDDSQLRGRTTFGADTGPDGRFAVTGLTDGSYRLQPILTGWASRSSVAPVAPDAKELTLTMWHAATIRGELRPPAGTAPPQVTKQRLTQDGPLTLRSNIVVRLFDMEGPMKGFWAPLGPGSEAMGYGGGFDVPVNDDWTFTASGAPGEWRIGAKIGDMATVVTTQLVEGTETHVVVDLSKPPSAIIEGTVTGVDGKPLGGVEVYVFRIPKNNGISGSARNKALRADTTDAAGRYRLADLPPGECEVRVVGYESHSDAHTFAEKLKVTLAEDGVTRVDIDFTGMGGTVLRVRFRAGEAGYATFMQADQASPGRGSKTGTADKDGWIEIAGLKAGTYSLRVTWSGKTDQLVYRENGIELDGVKPSTDVDRDLPAVAIGGSVTVPPGITATSATVVARMWTGYAFAGLPWAMDGMSFSRTCAADGSYRFPAVFPGKWRIEAHVPGRVATVRELEVTADTKVDLDTGDLGGSLVLRVASVKGRTWAVPQHVEIRYPDGKPVPMLSPKDRAGQPIGLVGEPGASCRVDGLPPGTLTVFISEEFERWETTVEIVAGKTTTADVNFFVRPTLYLRLPMGDYSAEELKELGVSLDWEGQKPRPWVISKPNWKRGAEGRWLLQVGLSKGQTVECRVSRPGFADHAGTIYIESGTELTHDVVWGEHTISGTPPANSGTDPAAPPAK